MYVSFRKHFVTWESEFMKVDRTVKKETGYIALFVLILSVFMEGVFLIAGYFDYTVILGNLLGGSAAILNFFLMGLAVQKAVTKEDTKDAKSVLRVSLLYRNMMLIAIAALGALLPPFNVFAVIIPLFFPRIAIAFRPLFNKN